MRVGLNVFFVRVVSIVWFNGRVESNRKIQLRFEGECKYVSHRLRYAFIGLRCENDLKHMVEAVFVTPLGMLRRIPKSHLCKKYYVINIVTCKQTGSDRARQSIFIRRFI